MALKGAVIHPAVTADQVKSLNLDFANAFSPEIMEEAGVSWTLHLVQTIPTSDRIEWACAQPNFSHWYLAFNEPDIATDGAPLATEQAIFLLRAQVAVVKACDPRGEVLAGFGSQLHTWKNPQGNPPWFDGVWQGLDQWTRDNIRGFHGHLYPEINATPACGKYDLRIVQQYQAAVMNWLVRNGLLSKMFWYSEFGFASDFDSPEQIDYLKRLRAYLATQHVSAWTWYAARPVEGPAGDAPGPECYAPLLHEDGSLTELGKAFAAI